MTQATITFYTVADASYFVGVVAMIASLRRHGHSFPVVVLDLGFTPRQRAALAAVPGCTPVDCPAAAGRDPFFLAPFPFMLRAEGTIVYIDADVVVTQPLDPILEAAEQGMVCVAPDVLVERWFEEWASIFGLEQALRRQVYVNAGFVVFSTSHFPDLLRRWWECCDRIAGPVHAPRPRSDPLSLPDQDALNALLMSEVPRDRQLVLPESSQVMTPHELARTKLVDLSRLACSFDGEPTLLLHPVGRPKPWQAQYRHRLSRSGYELVLRHLVSESASTVSAGDAELASWLRPGWRGDLTLRRHAMATALQSTKSRAKRALLNLERSVTKGRRAKSAAADDAAPDRKAADRKAADRKAVGAIDRSLPPHPEGPR